MKYTTLIIDCNKYSIADSHKLMYPLYRFDQEIDFTSIKKATEISFFEQEISQEYQLLDIY